MKEEVLIAIVDDNPASRKLEREKLEEVFNLEDFRNIQFTVKDFEDGKVLLVYIGLLRN